MEIWVDSNGKTVTGYGIEHGVNLAECETAQDHHDQRRISGCTAILPQVGPTLATKIEQLFWTTPDPVLDAILTAEQRKALVEKAKRLQFLSFPLAGITDHLLTLSRGTRRAELPLRWRDAPGNPSGDPRLQRTKQEAASADGGGNRCHAVLRPLRPFGLQILGLQALHPRPAAVHEIQHHRPVRPGYPRPEP